MSTCSLLSDDEICMCVNCGSEPPFSSMGPHHHPSPIHLLAGCRKLIYEHAQKLQEITFGLCLLFFSKGRSRVWLTSRLSWTGWPANKTPWFQLTTYHHRQRTKREGSRNSRIVHCINTLEKYMFMWAKKKLTKFPMSISVSTHSGSTKISSRCYQIFGCSGEMERERMEVLMRW